MRHQALRRPPSIPHFTGTPLAVSVFSAFEQPGRGPDIMHLILFLSCALFLACADGQAFPLPGI